jgi:TAT (twin-arginine translocation) pathway signal sequence
MNRRHFLKAGLIGGAALAAGSAWVVWRDVRDADAGSPPRDRIAEILGAIAPVILAGAWPADAAQRSTALASVTVGVKEVIAAFPPAVRSEVSDLFRLLDIRIARRLLAGVSTSWRDADPAAVKAFLERWRWSRIALLQTGYFALHDLVLGAWYANESAWALLGYPGPPNVE